MTPLTRWVTALMLACCGPAAWAQRVQGDVKSVGFRAPVQTGHVVRYGQWFPILVELNVLGTEHFQGELRFEGQDLDGDRVSFVQSPVVLTAGGGMRRVWTYGVITDADSKTVDVIDSNGALVVKLPAPAYEPISNDVMLVLDISERPVDYLKMRLASAGAVVAGDAWGAREFYRSIIVSNLPTKDLPDRWWGLEAVDVIVWDRPTPDRLESAQLEALIQWVRNGGQLVVGLGSSWPRIQKTALAGILPVKGNLATFEVSKLERYFERFVGAQDPDREFRAPVSVAMVKAARGRATFKDVVQPANRTVDLIVMDQVGSGRVALVAASLRELTAEMPRSAFLRELFDVSAHGDKFKEKEGEAAFSMTAIRRENLYKPLVREISFERSAGLLVLLALGFVVAYILLATFASWVWLRRRNATHLSWTAFAVFAVVGSALGIATVGFTRGVFAQVHAVSLVDLDAGKSDARAHCLFGYRSPRRQRVDLTLPGEGTYLRALARGPSQISKYATPERYRAVTGAAMLAGTPMRATLKQFEGFWRGSVNGTVRASISVDPRSGRVLPASWVSNDLDVDLIGGYLLFLDPRHSFDPVRPAGVTAPYAAKYKGATEVPPAVNVLAVRLPAIRSGERSAGALGAPEYRKRDAEWARWNSLGGRNEKKEPELPTLHDSQQEWVGSVRAVVGGMDKTLSAAALLSTRNLYLHCVGAEYERVGTWISTAGLVDADVSHWLMSGQGVLLLYSHEPGPAVMHANGQPVRSKYGRTLYRVRVPVQLTRGTQGGNAP